VHTYVADPIWGSCQAGSSSSICLTATCSSGVLFRTMPQIGDLRQLHFQGNLSHTTPLQTQKQVPEDVINIVPGKTLPEERECGLRVLPTVASRLMERL
jgi:hypothetical protein